MCGFSDAIDRGETLADLHKHGFTMRMRDGKVEWTRDKPESALDSDER